jgi:hypothetical protein
LPEADLQRRLGKEQEDNKKLKNELGQLSQLINDSRNFAAAIDA